MTSLTFEGVDFTLSAGDAAPRFVFGIRKSGSSIMNSMLISVFKFNDLAMVDLPGTMFKAGVPVDVWRHNPHLRDFFRPGNIYGGFRNAPVSIFDQPYFASARGILMVRDPRDALCSEFFSTAYTHSLPEQGMARDQMMAAREAALSSSIESFARRNAIRFGQTMREYSPILKHPGFRVYHYEKAIMDKRWFLHDAVEHLGLKVTDHQIDLILSWADVMPPTERPDQFVRRVVPGDHKDKFNPALIGHLNEVFAQELKAFGYQV